MSDNRTTETATSRIITTLRERNVQFATHGNTDRVWWTTENGVTWYAQDRPNANELFVKLEAVLTPEQAIAATLGRPKVKKVRGMTYDEHGGEVYYLACSGCGERIDGDLDCIGEDDGPNFCHNCGGEFDGPLLCRVCGELADMEFGDMCAECYWHEGEGNDER